MENKGALDLCPFCGYDSSADTEPSIFLKPGTVLNGKYIVGKVLGQGGFGITYLAWDNVLQVKLAVKEYLQSGLATRGPNNTTVSVFTGEKAEHFKFGKNKFLEEARTVARFDHDGIVSIKDFFEENNTAYYVMKYIDGITFKEYIERNGGRVDWETAVKIMMPVLDGLREVHRAGILHRDISPDNIYITQGGQVKILDFGAARYAMGEHSKSLSVMLKPGYAPDEQYRSKGNQGPWTDIYAVSATLYRAISGETPPEALDRLHEDTLKPPSLLGLSLPSHVEATIMKGLAVRSENRFQAVRAFQDSLMTGVSVEKPQDDPERKAQESKKEPAPEWETKKKPELEKEPETGDEASWPESQRGFFSKLFHGDYGIKITFWVFGFIVNIVLILSPQYLGVRDSSHGLTLGLILATGIYHIYFIFIFISIWCAAKKDSSYLGGFFSEFVMINYLLRWHIKYFDWELLRGF